MLAIVIDNYSMVLVTLLTRVPWSGMCREFYRDNMIMMMYAQINIGGKCKFSERMTRMTCMDHNKS